VRGVGDIRTGPEFVFSHLHSDSRKKTNTTYCMIYVESIIKKIKKKYKQKIFLAGVELEER
jgi:hypothetical protein